MPRLAISGGTGTVGRFIVEHFLGLGWDIRIIGRTKPAPDMFLKPVEFACAPLGDLPLPPDLFSDVDCFVHGAFDHIAGRYRGGEGDDPEGFTRRNVDGSMALFKAAKTAGVGHAIFLSSRAVYGTPETPKAVSEEYSPCPDTLYGTVKLDVENQLAALAGKGFLQTSLRITGVYGQSTPMAVHKWQALFDRYINGQKCPSRIATEVHGEDVASAVFCIISHAAQGNYNVSDIVLDQRDILAPLKGASKSTCPLPDLGNATTVKAMATGKLAALDWRPGGRVLFDKTITTLINDYMIGHKRPQKKDTTMSKIAISAPTDSGNIDLIDASNPDNIRLNIRQDGAAKFHQWFYFRASGVAHTPCHYSIENAGDASYVEGWEDYRVAVSYDLEHWFRVDTQYKDGKLSFDHAAEESSVYYAYFAPYPTEIYRQFIADIAQSSLCDAKTLGQTIDGEPLDLLEFGSKGDGKPNLWVIARQHPGETMGSWWMEGFLARLTNPGDAVATALREHAHLSVVPLVNIDGSRRGHLRTNTAGTDLNRAWAEPSQEKSPEVFAIRNAMDAGGCNFFFDVHGDEAIANNFIAGAEGVPSWSDTQQQRLDHFKTALSALSPAFQTTEGYPVDAPGTADLRIAANAIAERFGCLSMTLEMPFKDTAILPDENVGWSPERCRDLGATCLDAIWAALPGLR